MIKSKLGNKGFLLLTLLNHSPSLRDVKAGNQAEWEPEAGTDIETMKEVAYLLVPLSLPSLLS